MPLTVADRALHALLALPSFNYHTVHGLLQLPVSPGRRRQRIFRHPDRRRRKRRFAKKLRRLSLGRPRRQNVALSRRPLVLHQRDLPRGVQVLGLDRDVRRREVLLLPPLDGVADGRAASHYDQDGPGQGTPGDQVLHDLKMWRGLL